MKKSLLILCLLLGGCAGIPAFTSNPSPKMTESWSKSEDIIPIAIGEVKGKQVALNEVHRNVAVNRQLVGEKKPFFERIWGWFLGLGVFGGILAFFFPTAFFTLVLWLLHQWKKLKQAYEDHKDALTQTVKALKESGAVVQGTPLYTALDNHQDEDSKKLIAAIRATV